jgi:hypothetical protein
MNRQGSGVAYVANSAGDSLRIYHVNGAPQQGNPPQGCLSAPSRGSAWESPSWSPDGQRLTASDASGLYVVDVPGIDAGCPDAAAVTVKTIAPGGRFPDWGPANLPDPSTRPAAPAGPAVPGASPATTPSAGAKPVTPKGGAPGKGGGGPVKAAFSARVLKASGKAITVKVSVPVAGRLAATAEHKGEKIATAKARAVKAGTTTLTLKLKRALPRKAKPTVRLTLTSAKGAPQKATAR